MADALHFALEHLDGRGLLPLPLARRKVAETSGFLHMWDGLADGRRYSDADVLWGALLSLATPEEFARASRRLEWQAEPWEGSANVDPVIRFGESALVWVDAFLDAHGDLAAAPPNLGTCLTRIGTPDAWRMAGRVRSVGGNAAAAEALRAEWIRRNPETALACATDSLADDAWCRETVLRLADLGVPGPARLTAAAVLRELDRGWVIEQGGDAGWPWFPSYDDILCPHAMRRVAAVRPGTWDWCVAAQQIQGAAPEIAGIRTWAWGRVPVPGWNQSLDVRLGLTVTPEEAEIDPRALVTVSGVVGTCPVGPSEALDPSLAPVGRDPADSLTVSRIRVWLRRFRSQVWPDATSLVRGFLGDGAFEIVACTDRFHHDDDAPPSAQPAYRALAEAIEGADPSRFVPGESNVWFDDPERRRAGSAD